MKASNKTKNRSDVAIGLLGESIVCRFLEEKGYYIIERNYRKMWGEIDIIAEKRGVTHFVEVKTVSREPSEGIHPAENLHAQKVKRVKRATMSYLFEHGDVKGWRLDAALVVLHMKNRQARIDYIENIG